MMLNVNKPFRIKAVLFDFDGTLTKPGAIDFMGIKQAIDCPNEIPLLEFIETLPSETAKNQANAILEKFEREAASRAEPNDGAEDMVRYLRQIGLHVGILTRNRMESISRSLENFALNASDFDIIISRDDPIEPKPSADGVLLAAKKLNIEPGEILMVGDYVFDVLTGINAGAVTVFLDNKTFPDSQKIYGDFTIYRFDDLRDVIRLGVPSETRKRSRRECVGEVFESG